VVADGVPPAGGVAGLVLEHPAIATAITTSMIAMILIREIFKTIPSRYDVNAWTTFLLTGVIRCRD
jgi:hypothetical protein